MSLIKILEQLSVSKTSVFTLDKACDITALLSLSSQLKVPENQNLALTKNLTLNNSEAVIFDSPILSPSLLNQNKDYILIRITAHDAYLLYHSGGRHFSEDEVLMLIDHHPELLWPEFREYILSENQDCALTLTHTLRIFASYHEKEPDHQDSSTVLMNKIRFHVQANMTREDFARSAGLKIGAFNNRLKRYCGASFSVLIRRLRTGMAKYLLRNTDWSFDEIAYWSGLSSKRYMANVFKREFEYSPGQYKRAVKNPDSRSILIDPDTNVLEPCDANEAFSHERILTEEDFFHVKIINFTDNTVSLYSILNYKVGLTAIIESMHEVTMIGRPKFAFFIESETRRCFYKLGFKPSQILFDNNSKPCYRTFLEKDAD